MEYGICWITGTREFQEGLLPPGLREGKTPPKNSGSPGGGGSPPAPLRKTLLMGSTPHPVAKTTFMSVHGAMISAGCCLQGPGTRFWGPGQGQQNEREECRDPLSGEVTNWRHRTRYIRLPRRGGGGWRTKWRHDPCCISHQFLLRGSRHACLHHPTAFIASSVRRPLTVTPRSEPPPTPACLKFWSGGGCWHVIRFFSETPPPPPSPSVPQGAVQYGRMSALNPIS